MSAAPSPRFGIAVVMMCLLCFATASAAEPPTACDLLAAHPFDPDRIVDGRSQSEIMPDIERTIAACRRDVEHDASPRLTYYLGRVLFYSGELEGGLELVEAAAAQGHRQSQFVSALIRANGIPEVIAADPCHARAMWADAASRGHYAATLAVARHHLGGAFSDCEGDGPTAADMRDWLETAADYERAGDYFHGLLIGLLSEQLDD